jgi:hypothetical protein
LLILQPSIQLSLQVAGELKQVRRMANANAEVVNGLSGNTRE